MALPQRMALSDFDKGRIEGLSASMSHGEISLQTGIPRRTISDFLAHSKKHQTPNNLTRPRRPRITTIAQDKHIIAAAQANTCVPFSELLNIVNIPASVSIIRRRLHEDHIRKWRVAKRELLTEDHAIKHLKWAREHQHKTRQDWAKVNWSYECAFQKDSAQQQVWVFRHQTKQEKYAPKNIRGKARDGSVFQMIWGCFTGDKLGPIVFINGTCNSDVYIDILQNNLLPYLDALAKDGVSEIIFQQDNASCHVSNKTRAWFVGATNEHRFSIMDWPPNSPDMNLIGIPQSGT